LLINYTPIEQVVQPLIRFRKDSISNLLLINLNGTGVHVFFFLHEGRVGIWFVFLFDWSLWRREIIETASEGDILIASSDPLMLVGWDDRWNY
jgi:hypothetical protein